MSASPDPVGEHTPRDVLARSAFGTLWECHKGDAEKPSAAIRFLTGLTGDDRGSVVAAMAVAMGIDDGSCIAVRRVVDEDDVLAIVSAPVHGMSVRDLVLTATIKRKLLPVEVLVRIAGDMLTAVAAVHAHADSLHEACGSGYGGISPDSFVVGVDGVTRLLEPGLGLALSRTTTYSESPKRLGYDAPEVLQGDAATERSDIFSVGAIIWELLVGRRMLPGSNLEAMKRRLAAPIPRPAKRPKAEIVPEALASLIDRCLKREPDERFGDPVEVCEALEATVEAVAQADTVADTVAGVSPKRSLMPPRMTGITAKAGVGPARTTNTTTGPARTSAMSSREQPPKVAPAPPPKKSASSRKELPRRGQKTLVAGSLGSPAPRAKPGPPPRPKHAIEDELSISDLESTDGTSDPPISSKPGEASADADAQSDDFDVDLDIDAPDDDDDVPAPSDGPAAADSANDAANDHAAEDKAAEDKAADAADDDAADDDAAEDDDADDGAADDGAADDDAADDDADEDAADEDAADDDAADDEVAADGGNDDAAGNFFAPSAAAVPANKTVSSNADNSKNLTAAGPIPDAKPPKSMPPQKVVLKGAKSDPRRMAKTQPPTELTKEVEAAVAAKVLAQQEAKAKAVAEGKPTRKDAVATPTPADDVLEAAGVPPSRVVPIAIGAGVLLLIILIVVFSGGDDAETKTASSSKPNTPPVASSPTTPAAVTPAPEPDEPEPAPEPDEPEPDEEPDEPEPEPATPDTTDPAPTTANPALPRPGGPFPRPFPRPKPKPKGDYIPDDI